MAELKPTEKSSVSGVCKNCNNHIREKLVEILVEPCCGLYPASELADYLIEQGVTVQEWISVEDRLPNRDDMVIAFYETMRGTSAEIQIHKAWVMGDTCAHWMPLPTPPKGE